MRKGDKGKKDTGKDVTDEDTKLIIVARQSNPAHALQLRDHNPEIPPEFIPLHPTKTESSDTGYGRHIPQPLCTTTISDLIIRYQVAFAVDILS